MSLEAYEHVEAGRVEAGMSFDELWMEYFALGGVASPDVLRSYLSGSGGSFDYDVLAQAINERFVERGGNHPVPYSEDLG